MVERLAARAAVLGAACAVVWTAEAGLDSVVGAERSSWGFGAAACFAVVLASRANAPRWWESDRAWNGAHPALGGGVDAFVVGAAVAVGNVASGDDWTVPALASAALTLTVSTGLALDGRRRRLVSAPQQTGEQEVEDGG